MCFRLVRGVRDVQAADHARDSTTVTQPVSAAEGLGASVPEKEEDDDDKDEKDEEKRAGEKEKGEAGGGGGRY